MVTKSGEDLLYEKESYLLRGACFVVYKNFGVAFKEKVIHNALAAELKQRGLTVETQKRIDIIYKDQRVGVYIPDIVVNGQIIMELKAKPFLSKEDDRQFWYYLRGSQYKLGFLINFGSQHLQIKRRVYDRARNK